MVNITETCSSFTLSLFSPHFWQNDIISQFQSLAKMSIYFSMTRKCQFAIKPCALSVCLFNSRGTSRQKHSGLQSPRSDRALQLLTGIHLLVGANPHSGSTTKLKGIHQRCHLMGKQGLWSFPCCWSPGTGRHCRPYVGQAGMWLFMVITYTSSQV